MLSRLVISTAHGAADVRPGDPRGLLRRLRRGGLVEVGDDEVRAEGRGIQGDRPADAVSAADNQTDAAAERLRRRHALQLGFLEGPVLDVEGLAARERDVVRHRREARRLRAALRLRERALRRAPAAQGARPGHHADRVPVELGRVARLPAVGAEGEHPDAGHEHHRRVRVAEARRPGRGERAVVGGVLLAVSLGPARDGLPQRVERARSRVPGDHQGLDARAHEVVGAARADLGEGLRAAGVDKLQRLRGIVERANRPAHRRQAASQERQDGRGHLAPVRSRRVPRASEDRDPLLVLQDEGPELVDDGRRVEVALARRGAPREQAVAREDDAIGVRAFLDRLAQHHRELESRPLPGQPDERAVETAVELVELRPAVGARREGDRPVGVEVIDVIERQERVQRRVD